MKSDQQIWSGDVARTPDRMDLLGLLGDIRLT